MQIDSNSYTNIYIPLLFFNDSGQEMEWFFTFRKWWSPCRFLSEACIYPNVSYAPGAFALAGRLNQCGYYLKVDITLEKGGQIGYVQFLMELILQFSGKENEKYK